MFFFVVSPEDRALRPLIAGMSRAEEGGGNANSDPLRAAAECGTVEIPM